MRDPRNVRDYDDEDDDDVRIGRDDDDDDDIYDSDMFEGGRKGGRKGGKDKDKTGVPQTPKGPSLIQRIQNKLTNIFRDNEDDLYESEDDEGTR